MNIRLNAALRTVGTLAAIFGGALAVNLLIAYLTADQLITLAGFAFIGFFTYILYGINLSRLEFEAKLKEMHDQK